MNNLHCAPRLIEETVALIKARTGILLTEQRYRDLDASLIKLFPDTELRKPERCLERLQTSVDVMDALISSVTIPETYFFRNPEHFEFIRNTIIPKLLTVRPNNHVFRVWSAGCASGEEAYSLAILFDQAGLLNRTEILATDISRLALQRAQQAEYTEWSLRDQGAELVGSYLHKQGQRFKFSEKIRKHVNFGYLNLAQDIYPSFVTNTWGMDLILCRNVLIYLDEETIHSVSQRFSRCLRPDGYLLTSPADPSLAECGVFEKQPSQTSIVYCNSSNVNTSKRSNSANLKFESIVDGWDTTQSRLDEASHQPEKASEPEKLFAVLNSNEKSPRQVKVTAPETAPLEPDDVDSVIDKVSGLADAGETEQAMFTALDSLARFPSSVRLNYLYAILLINAKEHAKAAYILKRIAFLDRTQVVVQFALGFTLTRLKDFTGAARAFRNVIHLASEHPPETVLAMAEGECAGRLVQAAKVQVAALSTFSKAAK